MSAPDAQRCLECPTLKCSSNLPPTDNWPVPKCGVDRCQMLSRHAYPAYEGDIRLIAAELVEDHFNAPAEAVGEIDAILTAAKPTLHVLDQIYRHVFHPLHLSTIGEALVCPPKTRAKQLADAFAPVISMARRVEYEPPKPRKRSINPATKDFKEFTYRVGRGIAWRAQHDWGQSFDLDRELAKEKEFRPEHRAAILDAAVDEARRQTASAERELEDCRKAQAKIEAIHNGAAANREEEQ